jgi:O-antigen/teichoic acid export membrane protein
MIDSAVLRPQVVPPERRDHSPVLAVGVLLLIAAGGLVLVAAGVLPLVLWFGAVASVGLIAATAWVPMVGLVALLLAIPLTTGLPRGSVIPLLRTNEAILFLVTLGVLIHFLPRRQRRSFTGLDLAVISFSLGLVIIPFLVLFVSGSHPDIETWRNVLSPIQYLVIYFLFSRSWLTGRDFRVLLDLSMLASIIVAIVAAAQLADLPGVRDFLSTYYPTTAVGGICEGDVCRPTSLLEHWSGVGAFAVLNYTLALALATYRTKGFSGIWLGLVMAVNVGDVFLSQTQAAVIGLLAATLAVIWHGRRVPWREFGLTVAGMLVVLGIFAAQITARIEQQIGPQAVSIVAPESLQTRLQYWNEFFLPELADNVWTGTGTVIPSEVPQRLQNYVDNQYLATGFRAGVLGEALLLMLFLTIGVAGWRSRQHPDPRRRVIGGTAFASVLVLAVMGTTAEYLTYAGVAQEFWLVVALMGSLQLYRASRIESEPIIVELGGGNAQRGRTLAFLHVPAWWRRLSADKGIVATSTLLFVGSALARAIGFLFSVAAARILRPADYGLFAYSLAVVTIASVLVWNAPTGLSRFLARSRHDPPEQDRHFTNWMVVVALLLGSSLMLAAPAALLLGFSGSLLLGLLANLLGLAFLQAYREAQRGQERYLEFTGVYLLANLVQVVALVLVALIGWRDPGLVLIIYGLSSVAAVSMLEPFRPLRLRFVWTAISTVRLMAIGRFIRPLIVQTALFTVWMGADVIMVQRMMGGFASGNYAAAKALTTMLILAPGAVATGLGPRLARMSDADVARHLAAALRLAAITIVPVGAGVVIVGRPLLSVLFGHKYPLAAQPLAILTAGMACYGLYLVFETAWVSRGRPGIDPVATGVAMITTVSTGLLLVPNLGLRGAALAFTAGALAQLAVIVVYTMYAISRPATLAGNANEGESASAVLER